MKNICLTWSAAFVILFLYYMLIEFPMERSFVKGLKYLQQNEPAKASEEFAKVLKVYPKYEPVYLNVANYSLKNGQIEEGNERYRYAKRLCLINSEIFSARGLVYAKYHKNLDEGVAFYNKQVLDNYFSNLFYGQSKK